jgi:hypothetical protein
MATWKELDPAVKELQQAVTEYEAAKKEGADKFYDVRVANKKVRQLLSKLVSENTGYAMRFENVMLDWGNDE